MGPLTEEEMAIELFNAFQRLVSAVERIAEALDPPFTKVGTGENYKLTSAKDLMDQTKTTEGPKLPFDTH